MTPSIEDSFHLTPKCPAEDLKKVFSPVSSDTRLQPYRSAFSPLPTHVSPFFLIFDLLHPEMLVDFLVDNLAKYFMISSHLMSINPQFVFIQDKKKILP